MQFLLMHLRVHTQQTFQDYSTAPLINYSHLKGLENSEKERELVVRQHYFWNRIQTFLSLHFYKVLIFHSIQGWKLNYFVIWISVWFRKLIFGSTKKHIHFVYTERVSFILSTAKMISLLDRSKQKVKWYVTKLNKRKLIRNAK